jgi:hypothetical protein
MARERSECVSAGASIQREAQPEFGKIDAQTKRVGAVAASILAAAYHMIANGMFYHDLGANHIERLSKPAQVKRLVAKLQSLGYDVKIKPLAA